MTCETASHNLHHRNISTIDTLHDAQPDLAPAGFASGFGSRCASHAGALRGRSAAHPQGSPSAVLRVGDTTSEPTLESSGTREPTLAALRGLLVLLRGLLHHRLGFGSSRRRTLESRPCRVQLGADRLLRFSFRFSSLELVVQLVQQAMRYVRFPSCLASSFCCLHPRLRLRCWRLRRERWLRSTDHHARCPTLNTFQWFVPLAAMKEISTFQQPVPL